MGRIVITGSSGFVARHYLRYLEEKAAPVEVVGIDIDSPDYTGSDFKYIKLNHKTIDLMNTSHLSDIIKEFMPQRILHLASFSSVAFSWQEPIMSFRNNTNIFLNLLDAVRKVNPEARILSVGSSDEYGAVNEEDLPLREDSPLIPVSPYAVARVSQELLSKVYANGYGLDIVMTRSFNHIGTGQKDVFALSSFARQLTEIKKAGLSGGELTVGDVSVVRDFIDIRDVVEAYNALFERGRKGEVYNVCSGRGKTLNAMIDKMAHILGIDVTLAVSQNLVRPADNKIVIGSNDKIRRETGWNTRYSLDESLRDLLAYWMAR